MDNKITNVFFKYEKEFEGKKYLAGYAYKLELPQFKIDRLMRSGCLYAAEDAKYYKEEKIIIEKPVKKTIVKKVVKKTEEKVSEDVANKDSKQTKVQAKSTDK